MTYRSAILAGVLAAGALALPAHAGAGRTGLLSCGDGRTFDIAGNLYGNGYKLADGSGTFVVTYLAVDGGGPVLVKDSPGKQRLGTLSCSYAVSGTAGTATVRGFLTP